MTTREAERLLGRFEKTSGILINNRTRHMILRAVAAGTGLVGFHGIDADLATIAGIMAAAGLLSAHPTSWMETIPDCCPPPAAVETPIPLEHDPKPRFGL